jgi:hypothetical protein
VRIDLSDVYRNKTSVRFHLQQTATSEGPPCEKPVYSNQRNIIDQPGISFQLDETALYATTCLAISSKADLTSYSDRYLVGSADVPVHHYFDLQLKPNKLIPFDLRNKMAMIYSNGREERGTAAVPGNQGWYKASVRALGEYRLMVDSTAPSVKPIAAVNGNLGKARTIAFRVTDNLTSVKSLRGELDGKWILFEQNGSTWTYVFDEHCAKGTHRLVLTAQDENGNEAMASFTFTR